MEWINTLARHIAHYPGHAVIVLALVELGLLIGLAVYRRRWRTFRARWSALMAGTTGQSLESALQGQFDLTLRLQAEVAELRHRAELLESKLASCVQNVSVVRFDAFEDVGGEQSFALALLDEGGDGAVISTIYGRLEGRVYAKAISSGEAAGAALTDEERRAIAAAKSN